MKTGIDQIRNETDMTGSDVGAHSELVVSLSALEEDLLTLLLGRELYGLQMVQAIEEASGTRKQLKVGSLYPSLHRLEKKGFVTSRMETSSEGRGGNRRKFYRITEKGAEALTNRRRLRTNLDQWQPA